MSRQPKGGVMTTPAYTKKQVDEQPIERSICGFRQRVLKRDDGAPASITRLKTFDAQAHWHAHTDEYYYVLDGEGALFIDEERVPVKAGDCVWIHPGHVHRAEGEFEALIIGIPAFSIEDVHTSEERPTL
jgi:mannose-6-phosphate isomerase-like protein (cupin superfamily)